MSDYPTAVVREVNGQLVLDDPEALAVMQVVEAHNRARAKEACGETFRSQFDRVMHFRDRALALGKSPSDVAIVLICVDDPNGGPLADILMPGHDWQVFRDRGEVPYARGLAGREGIEDAIAVIDKEAHNKIGTLDRNSFLVVVIAHGTADVFSINVGAR